MDKALALDLSSGFKDKPYNNSLGHTVCNFVVF